MFEVRRYQSQLCMLFYISDGLCVSDKYMHRDGEMIKGAPEYWPARELAQAVLDKYQPEHVWEHGDVFESGDPITSGIMMYVYPIISHKTEPILVYINQGYYPPTKGINTYLKDATFLFNIKDKLPC